MGRHFFSFKHEAVKTLFVTGVAALLNNGCARSTYRQAADREAYCLINSRQADNRWDIPNRAVEPDRQSRMYLAAERDCAPKPPDDQGAHRYMVQPDCKNLPYYEKIATRHSVENPIWLDYLPQSENGQIDLTQPLVIDLALLHSRDYQSEFEQVYLRALELSINRFEFDSQWFGGVGLGYEADGEDLGNNRLLGISDRLGFQRNLAGGGQFATSVLNSITWNFPGNTVQQGSAAIVSTFTQPLLRGAFRHVRLENLTQAERDLLYQVRDFARFRRLFYVELTEQYLGLLTQTQAIRNTENNVSNLRQNLAEHEFYEQLETVSQVQVDQVFQQYQNGRRSLLSAQQELIRQQDSLKFSIGLPAWVSFDIDESLLKPFELVDPMVESLQKDAQQLFIDLVQFLPPSQAPAELLRLHFQQYQEIHRQTLEVLPAIEADLVRWQQRLESTDQSSFSDDDRLDFEQQKELAERIAGSLAELRQDFAARSSFDNDVLEKLQNYETNPPRADAEEDRKTFEEILQGFDSLEDVSIEDILPNDDDNTAIVAWKAVSEAIGRKLREEIAEIYVAQSQIRLFLIDIEPFTIPSENAISFALQNRLDLMNSKANVMDQFRKVEVAADALESDLSVTGQVAIGSDSDSNNPFKLDSANNQYQLGVQFDGPLNRRQERNSYRASQIAYQSAIRSFIGDKDVIANEVRQILRQLEFSRLSFQIARQQVFAATRQVDQAQIDLRQSRAADANLTIILLQALDGMLNAKNSLVRSWIDYRIQKMRLFAALEMLYLDQNGQWINEDSGLKDLLDYKAIDTEYFPLRWIAEGDSNSVREQLAPSAPDPVLGEDSMNGAAEELELIEAEILLPPANQGPASEALPE
ncbi:TolC family protein [Stieleria sp. JC731]|uniref:TolC family protein n=1 Tax=Pirellulaceae TaxID=2691357 RepID=UPI001E5F1504|nr:TolC family protein [Stieleria sp. JC731]MCC9601333.1 TolC family protein [Stieleria sp. JC731]